MSESSDLSAGPSKANLNVTRAFKLDRRYDINHRVNLDIISRGTTTAWSESSFHSHGPDLGIRSLISRDLSKVASFSPFMAMVRGPSYPDFRSVLNAIELELSFPSVRLALSPLLGDPSGDPVKTLVEYINNISADLLSLKDKFQKLEDELRQSSTSGGGSTPLGTPPFTFPIDPSALTGGDCLGTSPSYRTKIQVEESNGLTRVYELTLLSGFEGILRPSNYLSVRFRDLGRSGCEILFAVRTYDGRVSWSNSVTGGPCARPPSLLEIISLYNTLTDHPSKGCALG